MGMVERLLTQRAPSCARKSELSEGNADALPLNVLYYGRADPLPERYELHAGPLSATFEQGHLLRIRWRGREVLQRMYAAVRDRDWRTVPGRLFNVQTRSEGSSFQITFESRHQQDDIDFAWTGQIEAAAAGRLRFSLDGLALSTFLRSRIGFCLLHAARECRGKRFRVVRPDQVEVDGLFPEAIAMSEIVPGTEAMQALRYEVGPRLWLRLGFEGDVFQMEDQRAWTDSSFKTFCTPLHLACPVLIERGTRIAQAVRLEVQEGRQAIVAASPEKTVTVALGTGPARPLPAIGLATASHGESLQDDEIGRLRALSLSHLRVDLQLGEGEWQTVLREAARDASRLACPLEIAFFLSGSADEELQLVWQALHAQRPPIRRYLIFDRERRATSVRSIRLARRYLQTYDPSARFGGGTDANFHELITLHPRPHGLDFACFSIQPQTHAVDNESLVETLEVQGEVVRNAQRLFDGLPVGVSPVTLRPRFNADAAGPERTPPPGELPSQVDVRQMSLFGACWTLGSLKCLSENGTTSVTFFETTGWRGVMERKAGPPLPECFRSMPGAVFPLYHVLADVGEFAGGNVLPSQSDQPLKVECLALARDRRQRVLLANMTGETIPVAVRGFAATSVLVKRLDETTVLAATVNARAFRESDSERQRTTDGALRIELFPYAVVRIDSGG